MKNQGHRPLSRSTTCALILGLATGVLVGQDQTQIQTEAPTIVERGPTHRTWRRIVRERARDGSVTERVSSYVELASGMHVLRNGVYVESQEQIALDPVEGGAIADTGPQTVRFKPNANSPGLIDVTGPDGLRLRGHVLGLALYDPATGNSAWVAQIQDCVGELHAPQRVVYSSAFQGVDASLVYTYRRDGFAQDVVIHENIVLPEGFGPDTRLESWSEWIEAPEPEKFVETRQGLVDESLSFGQSFMAPGRAFGLQPGSAKPVPVLKHWQETEDGRRFLIEAVPFRAIKSELDKLPAPNAQAALRPPAQGSLLGKVERGARTIPAAPAIPRTRSRMQMASLPPRNRGLVVDFDLVNTSTLTFKSDTTYLLTGTVWLTSPVFEGGCVIKATNNVNAELRALTGLTWLATPLRPVIVTAISDHSVGEKIGTNVLSGGYYARYGLVLSPSAPLTIEHLRVSYAVSGLFIDERDVTVRHSQFVSCQNALEVSSANAIMENVLVYNASNVVSGSWTPGANKILAAHLTANKFTNFVNFEDIGCYLTNCLLVDMAGGWSSTPLSNAVVVANNTGNIFKTVGAGAHYLSGNDYRDIGVTNLSPALLSELKTLTTYPPVVLNPGAISNSMTLYAQAKRDMDVPDIGFHYQSIDWALGHVSWYDGTITVPAGVTLATYATENNDYGLALFNNARLNAEGTPLSPVSIVRHNTVQEQANTNWSAALKDVVATAWLSQSVAPSARLRFTRCSVPAQDSYHLSGYGGNDLTVDLRDCQILGGKLTTDQPTLSLSNCLLERVQVVFNDNFSNLFQHCTFFGGSVDYSQDNGGTFVFKNDLFDRTMLNTNGTVVYDYDAYVTNQTRFLPPAAHDQVLTNTPVYQTGVLGRYYFPTNGGLLSLLIDSGSVTNAGFAGLYHQTVTTNQVKDGSTWLDRAFHFVALTNGLPFDSDGDGLPDYLEDQNGDGTAGAGETSWTSYNSPNGLTGTPGLQVFTPLK